MSNISPNEIYNFYKSNIQSRKTAQLNPIGGSSSYDETATISYDIGNYDCNLLEFYNHKLKCKFKLNSTTAADLVALKTKNLGFRGLSQVIRDITITYGGNTFVYHNASLMSNAINTMSHNHAFAQSPSGYNQGILPAPFTSYATLSEDLCDGIVLECPIPYCGFFNTDFPIPIQSGMRIDITLNKIDDIISTEDATIAGTLSYEITNPVFEVDKLVLNDKANHDLVSSIKGGHFIIPVDHWENTIKPISGASNVELSVAKKLNLKDIYTFYRNTSDFASNKDTYKTIYPNIESYAFYIDSTQFPSRDIHMSSSPYNMADVYYESLQAYTDNKNCCHGSNLVSKDFGSSTSASQFFTVSQKLIRNETAPESGINTLDSQVSLKLNGASINTCRMDCYVRYGLKLKLNLDGTVDVLRTFV